MTSRRAKSKLAAVAQFPAAPEDPPWTPIPMLEDLLAKLKSGETVCEKMMIFMLETAPNDMLRPHYVACQLSTTEVIAWMEMAKLMAMEEWRGNGQ